MKTFHSVHPSPEAIAKFSAKDLENFGAARWDYAKRRILILEKLFPIYGFDSFQDLVRHLYLSGKSANEIAEEFEKETGVPYSARSVTRALVVAGVQSRPIKEAFTNAIAKGRVSWAYREHKKMIASLKQIPPRLRFEILTRDKFRCTLCGATKKTTVLEIDHITPRCEGGTNDPKNLRVLCHECNAGKRITNKEGEPVGGFVSSDVI